MTATINLSNGEFLGKITMEDLSQLMYEGYIKKEVYPEGNVYVLKNEDDISYVESFLI